MNGRKNVGKSQGKRVSARDVMALVSGGRRFEIALGLADEERNVTSLANHLSLNVPHVSQELSALAEYELVVSKRLKQARLYRLSDKVQLDVKDGLLAVTIHGNDGTHVVAHLRGVDGKTDLASVLNQLREDTLGSGRLH